MTPPLLPIPETPEMTDSISGRRDPATGHIHFEHSSEKATEGTPDAATLQTLLRQSADYVPHLIVIGGTCCPAGFRLGGVCDCGRAERQASLRWLADALPRILAAKARCDAMDAEPNPFHAVECRGHFHVKCEGETVDQSYYDQPAAEAECARRFIEWKTQRHSRTALLEQQLADSLAERSQLRAEDRSPAAP